MYIIIASEFAQVWNASGYMYKISLSSLILVNIILASVSAEGCDYKGQLYPEGKTWADGCELDCKCLDGTAGMYSCEDKCPTTYTNLPAGCVLVKPAGECCSVPRCNWSK
ncbi:hypothetical protein ScPMuIL_001494 [Solemya velum]